MASSKVSSHGPIHSLWHWPYVALTEVAILELLGAIYMLFYIYYVLPFENNANLDLRNIAQTLSFFAFLAGSVLLFLKRKVGIFVSLAGIIYMIAFGLYSITQSPFNRLEPPDLGDYLTDFTNPFGIPSLAIGVTLLIIGWKKVEWGSLRIRSIGHRDKSTNVRSRVLRVLRVLLFTALPIVSVLLLYFIFITDVRAALRSLGGI